MAAGSKPSLCRRVCPSRPPLAEPWGPEAGTAEPGLVTWGVPRPQGSLLTPCLKPCGRTTSHTRQLHAADPESPPRAAAGDGDGETRPCPPGGRGGQRRGPKWTVPQGWRLRRLHQGRALPASSGRVLSSSQGPWGSQVVTPIYRQTESEEQWALRLGPEHRQVASGTLVSRRAQPREGRTQHGLWPRRPRLSSPPERGVPRSPPSPVCLLRLRQRVSPAQGHGPGTRLTSVSLWGWTTGSVENGACGARTPGGLHAESRFL